MRTTTSGLLLLLIGVVGLVGYVSGRLNDWMAYLFSPSRPPAAGATNPNLAAIAPTPTPAQGPPAQYA